MDPLSLGLMGGSALFSFLGSQSAKKASEEAALKEGLAQKAAIRELEGVGEYNLPDWNYIPQEYDYIAGADPLMYQMPEELKANLVEGSPEMREAQVQALSRMRDIAEKGMTPQDQYRFQQASRAAGTDARGREEAIISSLRGRGMGGSGLEYALRRQAGQSSADRLAMESSMQQAQNAQLMALMNEAELKGASQVRGQDVQEQTTNAKMLNDFAVENSRRKQEIRNANTQLQNDAAKREIEEQRRIGDANTTQYNQASLTREQMARDEAIRKEEARRAEAQAMANIRMGQGKSELQKGAANAGYNRDMYNTVGNLAAGAYGLMNQPKYATPSYSAPATPSYDNYKYKGYLGDYDFTK